jgi:hypothetical protein
MGKRNSFFIYCNHRLNKWKKGVAASVAATARTFPVPSYGEGRESKGDRERREENERWRGTLDLHFRDEANRRYLKRHARPRLITSILPKSHWASALHARTARSPAATSVCAVWNPLASSTSASAPRAGRKTTGEGGVGVGRAVAREGSLESSWGALAGWGGREGRPPARHPPHQEPGGK